MQAQIADYISLAVLQWGKKQKTGPQEDSLWTPFTLTFLFLQVYIFFFSLPPHPPPQRGRRKGESCFLKIHWKCDQEKGKNSKTEMLKCSEVTEYLVVRFVLP